MSVNNVKKEPEEKIKAKGEEAKEEVIKPKEEKEEEQSESISNFSPILTIKKQIIMGLMIGM